MGTNNINETEVSQATRILSDSAESLTFQKKKLSCF